MVLGALAAVIAVAIARGIATLVEAHNTIGMAAVSTVATICSKGAQRILAAASTIVALRVARSRAHVRASPAAMRLRTVVTICTMRAEGRERAHGTIVTLAVVRPRAGIVARSH